MLFRSIYGWGHWNYTPDAKLMWEFMSKYARDLETGETIRLDLQEPDTPTDNPSDTPNDTEKPATQPSTSTSVKTGDSTMIAPFVIVASLSLFALVTVIKKSKAIR